MTLSNLGAHALTSTEPMRIAALGYLVRYRYLVLLAAGALAAAGIALQWHWTTSAGLLRIVAVLPCMLMMFRCMKCGMAPSGKASSSSSVPQQ